MNTTPNHPPIESDGGLVRALTPRELGKVLTLSDRTVRKRHDEGTLGIEGRQFGTDLRFSPGSVAAFLGITVDRLMAGLK